MTSNGVTVGMRQCLLSVVCKDQDNPLVREVAMDPIAAATSLAWNGSMGGDDERAIRKTPKICK